MNNVADSKSSEKRKSTSRANLKAASQEERILMWKEHFMNLLRKSPKITDNLSQKLGQFTQKDFDVVLTKIKNRKAAGLDEIPSEVWKIRKFDNLLL